MRASPQRVEVLERLRDLALGVERAHPIRVAIDGVDAAGKTTLADELAPLVRARGRPVIRASIDGFHRPRAYRHRRGAESPEGYYLDSFDHEALRSVLLLPLGPGGDRRYRAHVFDFRLDRPRLAPWRRAPDDAVLLFDGVFLQRPELAGCWDLCVFLEILPDEAVRRACARDTELFGSAAAARDRYERRYVPGQRLYLEQVAPRTRADVVVDQADPAAPRLLVPHAPAARCQAPFANDSA